MNNTVLGNDRFTYYETIGGGQGACPYADGPSGVHVAMSNTFNTPAEALELAYPLRVERYELRRGSGGGGLHRGGDGIVRELRILEPLPPLAPHAAPRLGAARRARRRGRPTRPELPERRGASRDREPRPRSPATSSASRPRAAAAGEGRPRGGRP